MRTRRPQGFGLGNFVVIDDGILYPGALRLGPKPRFLKLRAPSAFIRQDLLLHIAGCIARGRFSQGLAIEVLDGFQQADVVLIGELCKKGSQRSKAADAATTPGTLPIFSRHRSHTNLREPRLRLPSIPQTLKCLCPRAWKWSLAVSG